MPENRPVVHLELHTGDLSAARELYAELCGWPARRLETSGGAYESRALGRGRGAARALSAARGGGPARRLEPAGGAYEARARGRGLGGGLGAGAARRSVWLPYVEVDDVDAATARARALGASVLLEPREGPAGWRGVVATPAGGELAFWQPRRR